MSIFTEANFKAPNTNQFNLSHSVKFSAEAGLLIPVLTHECLPGDTVNLAHAHLIRLAPMVAPMMHEVNVYFHSFFVPNRILWPNWEKWISPPGGIDVHTAPYIEYSPGTLPVGSLGDFLGLPIVAGLMADYRISPIPLCGVLKIYNDYYRAQQFLPDGAIPVELTDGDNTATFLSFLEGEPPRRAWQHDYFTSALPYTQAGPEATIPLGTSAPLLLTPNGVNLQEIKDIDGNPIPGAGFNLTSVPNGGATNNYFGDGTDGLLLDMTTTHIADLTTATAAGIIDLRRAFALQTYLEKNARGGQRYTEWLKVIFNVNSSDKRLQRPEYLGGSNTPIRISEVLQTSSTDNEPTPQGNLAGHGISAGAMNDVSYFCEEHGYIHTFMSIMPRTGYFQGIPRHYRRFDKFDYALPDFAHIGEQPIYNWELYLDANDGLDDQIFGYIPRYAEYKYQDNRVAGEFRTSLDHWHWSRRFETRPALNLTFINANPNADPWVVTEGPHFYCMVQNQLRTSRKLPYFGNPQII